MKGLEELWKKEWITESPFEFLLNVWNGGSKVLEFLILYTWNLFVLYFGGWTLQNKVFSNQNKGHLGSRYIYKYHWSNTSGL